MSDDEISAEEKQKSLHLHNLSHVCRLCGHGCTNIRHVYPFLENKLQTCSCIDMSKSGPLRDKYLELYPKDVLDPEDKNRPMTLCGTHRFAVNKGQILKPENLFDWNNSEFGEVTGSSKVTTRFKNCPIIQKKKCQICKPLVNLTKSKKRKFDNLINSSSKKYKPSEVDLTLKKPEPGRPLEKISGNKKPGRPSEKTKDEKLRSVFHRSEAAICKDLEGDVIYHTHEIKGIDLNADFFLDMLGNENNAEKINLVIDFRRQLAKKIRQSGLELISIVTHKNLLAEINKWKKQSKTQVTAEDIAMHHNTIGGKGLMSKTMMNNFRLALKAKGLSVCSKEELMASTAITKDITDEFEDNFECGTKENPKTSKSKVAFIDDLQKFVDMIDIEVKNDDKTPVFQRDVIKVGLDHGQNLLKCSIQLLKKGCNSVHTTFLIAIGELRETYDNIQTLWINANLDRLFDLKTFSGQKYRIVFSCDLKMCNILAGVGICASLHPCYKCMFKNRDSKENNGPSIAIDEFSDDVAEKRTSELARQLANQYAAKLRLNEKAEAKEYKSQVEQPLLDYDKEGKIVLFGSVHMTLLLNAKLKKVKKVTSSKVYSEFEKNALKFARQSSYHGNSFEGNGVNQILKNIRSGGLEIPEEFPRWFKPVAVSLLEVLENCCSCNDLDLEVAKSAVHLYKLAICDMVEDGVPLTPKDHYIMCHLIEDIERFGCQTGYFSECAAESIHSAFKLFFARYQGQESGLKNALIAYNSARINQNKDS